MRNQRSFHRAAALLRRGMALCAAVALVCSLALSAGAVEVDVLNETTGLVESVDLDEDAAQPEEDDQLDEDFLLDEGTTSDTETADTDADEEPEETPTEETGEAPADADEETPKTDAEETPTEDNEEKSEDTSKADDTDDAAPDDDFLFVDDSTDEADADTMLDDDAFSVAVYADDTATQENDVYYYYNGRTGDSSTGDYSYGTANTLNSTVRHGFYNSNNTLTPVTGTDETTTMETFITNHPGATIHLVTGYELKSGQTETWDCVNITFKRAAHFRAVEIDGGTLTIQGNLKLEKNADSNGSGASLRVTANGTLNLYDDVIIEGLNCTSNRGGGVIYADNGTVNMYGGTLCNSNLSGNHGAAGGAVYVNGPTVVFNMYGGVIQDSTAYNGGGVYVNNGATFNMFGGTITGNTSSNNGGGVYIASGNFNISGGTIADNKNISSSSSSGVVNNGTMTITGGTVETITTNSSGTVTDGSNNTLYRVSVKIGTAAGVLVTRSDVTIKNGDTVVDDASYSFDDTYTDENGTIYLWLPEGYTASYKYSTDQEYTQYDYKAKIQKCGDNGYSYTDVEAATEDPMIRRVPASTKLRAVLQVKPSETTATQALDVDSYSLMTLSDDADTQADASSSGMKITSYQWQSVSGGANNPPTESTTWNEITNATAETYTPGIANAGQWVRAVITAQKGTESTTTTYASESVWVEVPQLSIAVPTSLTVTVKPDGSCDISASADNLTTYADATGTIQNNSAYPITLNDVTFTWNTSTDSTAPTPNQIFTNWDSQKPQIKLGDEFGIDSGNSITWAPNLSIPANGGSADLQWSFSLNGNAISQELQADIKASIGTITYTVSFADTASGGDSTTTTRAPGTPVVF